MHTKALKRNTVFIGGAYPENGLDRESLTSRDLTLFVADFINELFCLFVAYHPVGRIEVSIKERRSTLSIGYFRLKNKFSTDGMIFAHFG